MGGPRHREVVASERVDEVRNEGHEETAVELGSRADATRLVCAGWIDHALVPAGLDFLELPERRS